MNFLTTTLVFFAALASAASTSTPKLFDLTSSNIDGIIWNNLMFANESAYIGNIKYSIYSEPLLINGGKKAFGISFTSIHASPTGWRNLYVFANQSRPIQFTAPHSGQIPKGAAITGFGSIKGYLGLDRGKGLEEKWKACQVSKKVADGTWQIYWDGGRGVKLECPTVRLKIGKSKECRLPH